jgi:hypothetical protein
MIELLFWSGMVCMCASILTFAFLVLCYYLRMRRAEREEARSLREWAEKFGVNECTCESCCEEEIRDARKVYDEPHYCINCDLSNDCERCTLGI